MIGLLGSREGNVDNAFKRDHPGSFAGSVKVARLLLPLLRSVTATWRSGTSWQPVALAEIRGVARGWKPGCGKPAPIGHSDFQLRAEKLINIPIKDIRIKNSLKMTCITWQDPLEFLASF